MGCLGFSCHSVTCVVVVERQDAEAVRLADGHLLDRDGHVRALAPVLLDERAVVHLVDVVARQDEDEVGRRLADGLDVLEHRVRGAPVPLRGAVARDVRLHHPDAAGGPVEVPRAPGADVVVERPRVVLGQDDDVVDVRVDAVAEREVDDPVLARERHGGLGADAREDRQPLTLTAGEDDREVRFTADATPAAPAARRCSVRRGGSGPGARAIDAAG